MCPERFHYNSYTSSTCSVYHCPSGPAPSELCQSGGEGGAAGAVILLVVVVTAVCAWKKEGITEWIRRAFRVKATDEVTYYDYPTQLETTASYDAIIPCTYTAVTREGNQEACDPSTIATQQNKAYVPTTGQNDPSTIPTQPNEAYVPNTRPTAEQNDTYNTITTEQNTAYNHTSITAVQNETSNAPAAASTTEQNEVYCLPTVHSAGKNSSSTAAAAVPLQSRGDRATTHGGNTATAEEYDYTYIL